MKMYRSSLICLMVIGACSSAMAESQVPLSKSVLVCRSHQCAAASYSMTKGFLFNKLEQLIEHNIGKDALLCEADPVSHVCLSNGIKADATAAFAKIRVDIPSVKIVDTKLATGKTGMTVVMDYDVHVNTTIPRCQLGVSDLSVDYVDKVEMKTRDFSCDVTKTGSTSMNLSYNIDYLDFDYGFIGGFYTLGIGESVRGDKTGYMLMRFTRKSPAAVVYVPQVPVQLQQVVPAKPEATKPVEVIQEKKEPVSEVKSKPTPKKSESISKEDHKVVEETTPEKTTVTVVEKKAPSRPRKIKTTVTETTIIIPGPNGGNAVLPTFRTIGIPEIQKTESSSVDSKKEKMTDNAIQFQAPEHPRNEDGKVTEKLTDIIYLHEPAKK